MDGRKERLILSPEASLGAMLTEKVYDNSSLREYYEVLDLSEGKDMYKKCTELCSWYDDVAAVKERFITELVCDNIDRFENECQIISIGCGITPRNLEILSRKNSKILRVFEIDFSGTNDKTALYERIAPQYSHKLRCIHASPGSMLFPHVFSKLDDFSKYYPSIIIAEGISSYISDHVVENIISGFSSDDNAGRIIIEYLLPEDEVTADKWKMSQEIYKLLYGRMHSSEFMFYVSKYFDDKLNDAGGELLAVYTLKDMERTVYGRNSHFKMAKSGWLQFAFGKI